MTVTDVNGPGYETPDEASEAAAVNMDYEVIPWDKFEDDDIIIDGPNYISVGKKRVELERSAGSTYLLPFSSSYSKDEIQMSFVKNTRFDVEVIEESGAVVYLKFTALEAYNSADAESNKDTLKVKAGRISLEILVYQKNSNVDDWINGGDNETELTGKE